uniref:C2 NT-type domain-containing protein n=1 Tax=Heliothis virescens TaxID=7102 RepID=A0A2A4K8C1_HELVI
MASVWKRLQRVNKRAAKFQYTASYHRVDLETSPKWKPNKLSVVWSETVAPSDHRTFRMGTFLKRSAQDSRTNELEDKDWTFVLEDVSVTGKRRRLAVCSINMRKYASLEPSQRELALTLDPVTQKVVAASVQLTLHCVLLREGQLRMRNEKDEDSDKTPTAADMEKLFPGKFDKDKTPSLLEWVQGVTKEYRAVRVTNLTTASGPRLAFCAIIHRFRPDLIDFPGCSQTRREEFSAWRWRASSKLGISQVLTAADVCSRPDT